MVFLRWMCCKRRKWVVYAPLGMSERGVERREKCLTPRRGRISQRNFFVEDGRCAILKEKIEKTMKEESMKPDITWLDNPEVFRVGQLPAHSDHGYTVEGKSPVLCLNGQWDFAYSKCAKERPEEFYKEAFDCSEWDRITVPGHIELAGYDKVNYINVMYPWEGMYYRRPAGFGEEKYAKGQFSEADCNPVGSYVTKFDLPADFEGKRVIISFEGVEQAMYLWINGEFVGYAEDSFTPSEFDLTPYIRKEGNLLAVEVHKRSTAAYIEDQDFFRFFGIFRDVKLYAKGEVHAEDIWVKPVLCEDNESGTLSVDTKLSAAGVSVEDYTLEYALKDKDGRAGAS